MSFLAQKQWMLADAVDWSPLCLAEHLTPPLAIALWQQYNQERKPGAQWPKPLLHWALVVDGAKQVTGLLPHWQLSLAPGDASLKELCLPVSQTVPCQALDNPAIVMDLFQQTGEEIILIADPEKEEWGLLSLVNLLQCLDLGQTTSMQSLESRLVCQEQQLQANQQQWQTLVNTIADGIVIIEASGQVIYANPIACQMFGILKTELLQFQLGLPAQKKQEISIILPENKPGVGEINSVPIHWQGKDCTLVTVRDVTDRQGVLQKLQQSEQKYRMLLETIPNLVWRLDADGKILEYNQQTLEYFGKTESDIIDDNWQQFIYNNQSFRVQYDWQEGLENCQFFQLECRLLRGDGQYRWQLMQVLPCHNNFGQVTSWLMSSTDIDDLKRAEFTLRNQANQEKLLSSVGQRIRQSLQLETILQITVMEVRRTMEADRVFVYQIDPDSQNQVIAESVIDQFDSVIDLITTPLVLPTECHQHYLHGYIDVSEPNLPDCTKDCPLDCFSKMGSKARMVAPLVFDHQLWGLLIVHQCAYERKWQTTEIQFMQNLADQLAIAIQQSLLYGRLKAELAERKRAERQLLAVNQLQKGIFDVANYIIISTDKNGIINSFNRTAEQILGYTAEEVIGKLSPLIIHDPAEIKAKVPQISKELGKTINPDGLDVFAQPALAWGVYESEWIYVAKNGDRIPINLSITTLKDGEGNLTGLVGVASDLRQQKQTEKERQNLEFVVKNSTELIVIADLGQKIIFLNQGGQQLLGLQNLALAQKNHLYEYISPGDLNLWQEKILPQVLGNGTWEGEFSLRHYHTNQEIPVMASTFLVRSGDGQQAPNLVVIMHDITEIKQAEKQILAALEAEKELSSLRSRFIATTSHEFRTPLAVIGSSTGILKKYWSRLQAPKREEHLVRIETNIERMVELLDDVLTINRAESHHLEFRPQPQDLSLFCREICEEIRLGFGQAQLLFTVAGIEEGESALFDPKLLRQILTNLLSNAIKYSPNNPEIELILQRHNQGITFTIKDQGIGITPDDLTKIFDSFYRASNIGNIPGTGLGLPIVKKCVELHGGTMTVTSEVGKGSCFQVSLPVFFQS